MATAAQQMKGAVMDGHDDFYRWQKLTLQLTNVCDLACTMCPVILGKKFKLSRDQAFDIVDFAKRRGFEELELGGGEPTLLNYFWDLLDSACESPMRVTVLTNGVRTTDEHIARFAQHPNVVAQISVDGIEEVHDAIRLKVVPSGESAYAKTERTLHALAAAGVPLAINTVVQAGNWRTMVETYERLKSLPYLYHGFSPVEGYGHEQSGIPASDMAECMAVLKEVQARGARDGKPVALSDELLLNYRLSLQFPEFKMHPGRNCTVVKKSLAVTHDGYVLPCWHYGWNNVDIARNVNQRSLDEIVDDPAVRDEIRHAVGPMGCRGCTTMCYNWDLEFQKKVMGGSSSTKVRRAYQQAVVLRTKDYVRRHHPGLFAAAKSMKRSLLPG